MVLNLLPENLLWLECLLRVLFAILLGFAVGSERQLRLKAAGIRTHAVVSAGACLFVLVSVYGFPNSDSSRVAAQIVSGIGFIGAGMILHRQNVVHGLTSAAGIWLTAAIGMAAGAGLYIVSLGATVLIILTQLLLHLPIRFFKEKHYYELNISFISNDEQCQANIKNLFQIKNFTEFKADRRGDDVVFTAVIQTKMQIDDEFISKVIKEHPYILSIRQNDSDN